ncbi:winged helix-turn-helix transcriptional regulator [Streptomyces megasporus]|uniref:winged helix-turn-helix transcriptional regulator n=1 Tax=Streptomyces megasporus TaxID=44060 RepID=UPI000A6C6A6C|nr:winged helix-turn-helix transcriptional regulator [Streptomyces megasporus]
MLVEAAVHRELHREVPPRVEYSPTEAGASLDKALLPLGDRGEEHVDHITAARGL